MVIGLAQIFIMRKRCNMTKQEWENQTYLIATELYRRLKYIAIYGNEYCFHPSNMELVEKWENNMNKSAEEEK